MRAKGIVPVLRALADSGFQGPALGDLGYRGERLTKAGETLGITVEAIARGRDGRFARWTRLGLWAGCSTGCAAPGVSPAVMPRNRAPWSSIVAPAARRRVALNAALTAGRRYGASRSRLPSTNTVSRWRSMFRRQIGMTRKAWLLWR